MNEFQTYINHVFQLFGVEDDNNSDSPRDLHFSQSKTESSNTIVMSVIVMEVVNLEEQVTYIKTKLDIHSKESA